MSLRRTQALMQGWSHLKSVEWLSSQQPSAIVSTLRPPGAGTAEKPQVSTNTVPTTDMKIKKKMSVEERIQILHDQLRKHGDDMQQEKERLHDFMKSIQLQLKDMEERHSHSQATVQEVKARPVAVQEEAKQQEKLSTPLRGADIAAEQSSNALRTSSSRPPQVRAEPLTQMQLAQLLEKLKKNQTISEDELRVYGFHQLTQIVYYLKQHGDKQLSKAASSTLYHPLLAHIVGHGQCLHTDLFLDLIREMLSWGLHDIVLPKFAIDAVQQRQRGQHPPPVSTVCSMMSMVCVRYNPLYNETLGSLFNQVAGGLSSQSVQYLSPVHMKLLAELAMGSCLAGHVSLATRTHCLSVLLQYLSVRSSTSLSLVYLRWDIFRYLAACRDTAKSEGQLTSYSL